MKEFLIFCGLTTISVPIVAISLKVAYKKSYLFKVGLAALLLAYYATIASYAIATLGLISFPLFVVIGIIILILLAKMLNREIVVLKQLNDHLHKLSNLDLVWEVDKNALRRKDEFGQTARSVESLQKKLLILVEELDLTSENLFISSGSLNGSAKQIAFGAEKQAEEASDLSVTLEELSSTLVANNEKFEKTSVIANNTVETMNQSEETLSKLIKAITTIDTKINLIEEIAGQTNLLALNAAVEAARAKEHGKGFSVVSAEIRQLSENTHEASNDISVISKSGTNISKVAAENLNLLTPEIALSATMIEEIAQSNLENMKGILDAGNSIQELSVISNQNLSSSKKLIESADHLASQANTLKRIVGQFQYSQSQSNSS